MNYIKAASENSGEDLPRLLLHCCCAPCASHVLESLSSAYRITALFFNPNIEPRDEYDRRADEIKKLLSLAEYPSPVDLLIAEYETAPFRAVAEPYADEPEGGRRCAVCFYLRLGEAAIRAKAGGYDFFATTLTVSPHKPAQKINDIGAGFAERFDVKYLQSDFKKRDGYKRSVELSKKYGLYRQQYCCCRFSQV